METLADRIALSGKLDPTEAVTLVARLALLLERLHAAGEVHGAISPDAIVLRDRDVRRAALRSSGGAPRVASYLSPERLQGKPADKADDAWAIGALLYALLTGHSAFAGATEEKVAARMKSGAVAPLAVFDVADDAVAEIVDAMLVVERDARLTSVLDLRRDLELWLDKRGLAIGAPMELVDDGPSVKVDLASIPPPPKLPDAKPAPSDAPSPFAETLDEETTQPREDKPRFVRTLRERIALHDAQHEAKPSAPPPASSPSSSELAGKLPATSELLARAKKATTRPPPRLNPPRALTKSSRPPPLPGAAPSSGRGVAEPAPASAPSSPGAPPRKSAPVIPLGPSPAETPSFDEAAPSSSEPLVAKAGPRAATTAERAPKKGGPSAVAIVAAVAALGVGGYAVSRFVVGGSAPGPAPAPGTAAATHEATGASPTGVASQAAPSSSGVGAPPSAIASTAPPPPSAEVSAAISSSPIASSAPVSSAPPIAAPADLNACFIGLLAEGAVAKDAHPELGFVCKDPDPRKASGKVKSVVVAAARGHVTDAMREWSMLGYWELAAYAAMRGHCCPNARPIELPASPGACPSLADALNAISASAHPGVTEAAQADAAKGFHDALRCVVKSGQEAYLGDYPPIAGGQDTAFMKTFARTRR